MNKLLALTLASVLVLAGCGKVDRITAAVTGSAEVCVDHVKYIQFTSGASVKYTTEGKIQTC
jgi:ABC-type glycerol-3-phosphate transport system substrate-binding protein